MSGPGLSNCVNHGEIQNRVVNLEGWKDRVDTRLDLGEVA